MKGGEDGGVERRWGVERDPAKQVGKVPSFSLVM
jgi:hypothetical protein